MIGGLFNRLKQGLQKTSQGISEGIQSAFTGGRIDEATLEALEDTLIQADMGLETAANLCETLRKHRFGEEVDEEQVRRLLADKMTDILTPCAKPLTLPAQTGKPAVLMMVGVNGSGKTTTIGKLAAQYEKEGKNVMLAAGDTFRAGATQQLEVWAERARVPIVLPEKEGADPAGLLYTAYAKAQEKDSDILIADTAGRLQNRDDLMQQLAKMVRVIKKHDESAPHACVLVLDGTVGQNAHQQVEAFCKIANVTGLVITKLDSSAKAGVVVALAEKFGLPIHYIGVGERIEDLQPFNPKGFAYGLMGLSTQ